jgi:hypothetical protein
MTRRAPQETAAWQQRMMPMLVWGDPHELFRQ